MKYPMLIALLTAPFAFSAVQAAPAREFLHDAIQGDNSEMTLGQLAMQRGMSQGIRDYGRRLHTDHSHARVQASAVARRMGVSVPSEMMPEARSEYHKLLRLHGRAFDSEFARYMVDDHQKDIAKFQDQARSGDRQTARLAREQLPVLREHLRIAQSLNH
jgi:putative membrane protein